MMYKVTIASLLTLIGTALSSTDHDLCFTRPYSAWMADSIISRGQGIAFTTVDSSILLQDYASFLTQGTKSIVTRISNATADTSLPLDRLSLGKGLLTQYYETRNETYKSTVDALRGSIDLQPKNQYGGYWYYVYPNWSYLDGMFSLVPFYSLYTTSFTPENSTTVNDDILLQLDLLWEHCYDNTTGLLFHGYDASKTAVWANPISGSSSIVWSRSLGWYVMAVVDYLELKTLPEHLWRGLLERFIALADALINTADPQTGSWWQAMNFPGRSGNYIESSGSAMFTYALYKGVRLGYLGNGKTPAAMYSAVASKAYRYIVDTFIVHNVNGTLSYNGTVSVCSLNSTATYEYYVTRPLLFDSVLGSAPFIMASVEHEIASASKEEV